MSSETAVNGGQHVVSTCTNMSSEDADECVDYASTTAAIIAKSHQASTLKQLNADVDAVIIGTMAADVDADNSNVQAHSSSKDKSKVCASRKRSRQRNGDTSKCRNSKNRATAAAAAAAVAVASAASDQIRPVVDDFDTLFDEIRANGDDDDADVAIVQTDSDTLQRAAIKVKDGVVCDQQMDGNDDVNDVRAYSTAIAIAATSVVFQHSHLVLTTASDANTNHQAGIDIHVNADADADSDSDSDANANANAFANHQQCEVVSIASDSLMGEAVNTNAAVDLSHRADQHVPYRTSTNGRPTPILSSENTFTLVEKSSSSTCTSTSEQCSLIEECRYNIPDDVIKDVVRESKYASTAEKKTTKKKKSVAVAAAAATGTGTGNAISSSTATTSTSTSTNAASTTHSCTSNGVAPKTKKSKKSKKYSDEKENISVVKSSLLTNNNYDDDDDNDDLNFHQILDDGDEFSNVCVRELRSGFGKFDQLTKKTLLHVRSQDSSKAQQNFSQGDNGVGVAENAGNVCKACSKNVFAMELIKAERAVWHKNCFRCSTCGKQLTVDIYSSHEGKLYCKPHFKDLFKPKVVVEDETPVKLRKPELIIRENQPLELPPDVVRACDKPDLGLDELSNLNVKSRFQVFEKQNAEEDDSATDRSTVCVKRSPSILSKLAKFQAKGMDVGVSSDIFNGIDYEESASSEDEQDQTNTNENSGITKNVVSREKPVAFNKMNDVKKNWENGNAARKEERREERREELQRIRSRLFMGKQNKMREAYENAVAESEKCCVKRDVEVKAEKARLIKEKFEKGEVVHCEDSDEEASATATARKSSGVKDEDMDVFEAGISKKSRSLFQQMDAAVKTSQSKNPQANSCPQLRSHIPTSTTTLQNGQSQKMVMDRQLSSENLVRCSDPVDQVVVETADVSSKFKFFETYKPPEVKRKAFRITPPREGQLLQSNSPEKDVAPPRCEDNVQGEDESQLLKKSHTTAKMLSLFRQLEEAQQVVPDGPKPMKKFTPPPVSSECSSDDDDGVDEEESTDEEDADAGRRIVRASDKTEDEYLKVAQAAAKAKSLKEKFEKWQPEKQSSNNAVNLLDSEQASLDTAKSLTARFESFKTNERQTPNKPRPKVNRFVDKSSKSSSGCCNTCLKTVYQLEKVEAGDKIFHRSCFRCSRCNGVLRMETFTMNNGQLYCVPHFKQLFIVKGNYDEGFGNDQHKSKWSTSVTVTARPDVVPTTVTNSVIANTLM